MARYVVIVDPVSTGQEYAEAFRAAGAVPVAVLSGMEPAPAFTASWHPENFEHVHYFDGDLAALAEHLKAYSPECVIPGAESGVELADALIEELLPGTGNVPDLASARRDKWEMKHALARAGLPHLRQICSDDLSEVEGWLREQGLEGQRLVVKPHRGAGGDQVHVVPPEEDWRTYFRQILGATNKMGEVNHAVLVQEFADGTEYLVDTYSVDGRHAMVDVCRYTKVSRGSKIGIYRRIDFLEPDHPEVLAIWPYVQQVLDAVGIRVGCGHVEVMQTSAGPRLLEVAARPAGGGHQMVSELATGDNHIKRTVAHRMRGEVKDGFELVQHLRGVFISAPRRGLWHNREVFDGIDELKSFHKMMVLHDEGAVVPETVDLFTCLAWVMLIHSEAATLDEDYQRVLEMEARITIDPVE
jgi:carbamoylphosphate synthase large subunit